MTKVFKNSKQVLSFVIAFAIIAVSLFTGVVINADAATAKVLYYSGTPASSIANVGGGDGSSADKAIIIASAEELAYLVKAGAGGSTAGKYYKIADGIGSIVLQPEAYADEIKALSSADEVKTYFEDESKRSSLKWWVNAAYNTSTPFGGNFDGNGVEIYGLFCDWTQYTDWHLQQYSGLFTVVDAGAVIKNVSIKNSYMAGGDNMGAITSYSSADSQGYKTKGSVKFDGCIVTNCYIESSGASMQRAGVLAGNISDYVIINNCFVYGNIAKNTNAANNCDLPLYGNSGAASTTEANYGVYENVIKDSDGTYWFTCMITNSIVLGATPYPLNNFGYRTCKPYAYENVYTDQPAGTVQFPQNEKYKVTYAETDIKQITATTGEEIKAEIGNGLDWENTWVVTNGYPELRAFHNLTAVTPDANGHGYKCADCDINAVVAHAWGEDFKCVECGYACKHDGGNLETTNTSGDCVTAPGQYVSCKECGYSAQFTTGTAPGHMFEHKEGVPADCLTPGVYDYWHCTVCDGNYLGDKEELLMAPIADGKKDPAVDFVSPLGGHSQKTDADGVIVIVDGANGHYYECSVCDGKLNHKSEEIAKDEVIKHDFSASVCKQCGWKCEEHDYELTGNVLVVGDCNTDHEDELKCKICGKQESEVTKASHKIVAVEEVKATDKIEGTKAHYQCTECKSIYADAEGKTSVTKASLVVPKKLPAGYENTYGGTGDTIAPENADTSTTSPATSDNVITVIATAVVLMGAAYVVVRKIVKA